MVLYFAYGSNMSIEHMLKYCFDNEFKIINIGILRDYIYRYRTLIGYKYTGVGNIEKRKGSKVYGIIYDINKNGLKKLNKKEGLMNNLYYIDELNIYSINGKKKYKCKIYKMNHDKVGIEKSPTNKYRKMLLDSAIHNRFPKTYINRLLYI
tara:strand:- start:622 stop:1074 length:453 start_codon:yes stop_codon:yes gene_type:complete